MSRAGRIAGGLLAATVFALGAGLAVAPAQAIDDSQGRPGFCPDDDGVTVVVDFQDLGGETVVRCSPGSGPRLALEVLEDAGFQVDGVARWGDGFVCRIEDRPSAGEQLPIEGDDDYQEACIDTPPASGYWSYWYADDGGDWQYSPYGVKNRMVQPGGFEGWSFALNATDGEGPTPRVAPDRPETGTSAPDGSPGTGSSSASGRSDGQGGGTDGGAGGQGGEGAMPLPREQGTDDGAGLSTRVAEPTEAPEWTGGEALPDVDAERQSASPVPALLGLGGAAALVGIAVVVSVRRRRSRLGP